MSQAMKSDGSDMLDKYLQEIGNDEVNKEEKRLSTDKDNEIGQKSVYTLIPD